MKSLETLDGQPCSNKCSRAMSINTRGHVVGFINMLSVGQRAFFWENGKMFDLGLLEGGVDAVATAINDRTEIVGGGNSSVGRQTRHIVDARVRRAVGQRASSP